MSYEKFSEYVRTAGVTDWLNLINPLQVRGFEDSGIRANKAARKNLNFIIKVAYEIGLDDIGDLSYYRISPHKKKGSSVGRGGSHLREPHDPPTSPKSNTFLNYLN